MLNYAPNMHVLITTLCKSQSMGLLLTEQKWMVWTNLLLLLLFGSAAKSGEPNFPLGNQSESYVGSVSNTKFVTVASGLQYRGYKYNVTFL